VERRWSQALSSDDEWQDKRQWAQTKAQEIHSEYQETFFSHWGWLSTSTGCPQKMQSLHPCRYSKEHYPGQLDGGGFSWAGCLDKMRPLEMPSNLELSVILFVCEVNVEISKFCQWQNIIHKIYICLLKVWK